MNNIRLVSKVIGCLLLVACGAEPGVTDPQPTADPTPAPAPAPTPTPPPVVIPGYQPGLQSSGAIGFTLLADKKTRLEFSAPITPRIGVLYPAEGANYPTSPLEQATLAHNAALTFEFLLTKCVADYPDIKLPTADADELTSTELSRNYNSVAECSYEKYTAKPYWIPQLLDDVDICANELGAGWRLPTEADIASLSDADFDFLSSTLVDVTSGAGSLPGAETWGRFYFSLSCYVRGSDGTLKLGDLSPAVTERVTALGVAPELYKNHLESGASPLDLRCVRRTALE